MRRTLLGLSCIACLFPGAVRAESEHSLWWLARARVACIADVLRLCKAAMPDEDRVTACMADKKTRVSPGCAAFYPGGEDAD